MSTATTPLDPQIRPDDEQYRGHRVFLLSILVTVLLLAVGLTMIHRDQQQQVIAQQVAHQQQLREQGVLLIPKISSIPKQPDPVAEFWTAAPIRKVTLKPQNVAMPAVYEAAITEADLQAVWDGSQIAFRVSWADSTVDQNVDTARFTDAVAIQFPLVRDASFMMGGKLFPVQIIQWKALWQKDIDEHFQDVQDVHPNYWADFYWFATPQDKHPAQGSPYRVPESFQNPTALMWFAAHQSKNPEAQFERRQPVQEMIAEGFGSLVAQTDSASRGCGVYQNGRWYITIVRPLTTEDREDFQFYPGQTDQIGVAIWEGSSKNVGGRKQYSDWISLQVQP
ncbi:MAG: hypothetical protein HJJLKODD_02702 [Phycisphaerae bacterium]|nr:hypothetical protein [Phycisphaerae bacterium]